MLTLLLLNGRGLLVANYMYTCKYYLHQDVMMQSIIETQTQGGVM